MALDNVNTSGMFCVFLMTEEDYEIINQYTYKLKALFFGRSFTLVAYTGTVRRLIDKFLERVFNVDKIA